MQAALKLANTILNSKVQDMFARSLLVPSSEPFFAKLQSLFAQSKEAIKENKRHHKLQEAEMIWRRAALDNQVKLLKRQSESGDGGGRGSGSPAARLVEVHQTRAQLEDEVKTLAARGTGNSPVSG